MTRDGYLNRALAAEPRFRKFYPGDGDGWLSASKSLSRVPNDFRLPSLCPAPDTTVRFNLIRFWL